MPAIDPSANSRVLVTGANGFIGAHVVKVLLDRTSYEVVATVRTAEKAAKTKEIHGNNPRLILEVVPDITSKDAFLNAADKCDAIIHLAAPFGYAYKDFEKELLIPSIDGVKAICHAASMSPSVKRLVFASSFASVYDSSPEGMLPSRTYTEADWSPLTYEDGKNAPVTPIAYRASKVLAEKEAWDLSKQQDRWDLVSLCPGMVFGELVEGSLSSLKELNTSNAIVWGVFDKDTVPETRAPLWTSVVSLAEASLSALTVPEASNERFLLLNGPFDNQQLCDMIRATSDLQDSVKERVPVGKPGQDIRGKFYKADYSKAERMLEFSKPSLDETVVGLVKQLISIEETSKSGINGVNGVH